MKPILIIALDFSDKNQVLDFIKEIDPSACALKIGSELFTILGPDFVRDLVSRGYKIFLDLKFHDIPNTVAQACHAAACLGVWMINVHASGGLAMMQAAKSAVNSYGQKRPLLIAVTVLTSMSSEDLPAIGVFNASVEQHVSRLAQLALKAHLDGVVCSAYEVPVIKSLCGPDFLTITPGIRLESDEKGDQIRVMTPEKAIRLGSDYLVMGRSITKSLSPEKVIKAVLSSF